MDGCLALVKLTSLGVMQSFPHTAASSCVGLAGSKHQAASRGVHRPRTTARQVKVVVVTSGKGREDPSQIVVLQREGVAGRREGVCVSRRAAWTATHRTALHCTALHVFLVCLGWLAGCQDRTPYAEPVDGGIEEGGRWMVVDPIRVDQEGFEWLLLLLLLLLFVVGGRVEPESGLDLRSRGEPWLEKSWCPFVIWPGSRSGPVLSALVPRPTCSWLLAPGCWLLLSGLGTGGFGRTDGGGAERGPRGTGDGRRRDVDDHWSGAGRGLARVRRWSLVGR